MLSNSGNRWTVGAATFALWVLVAASAGYWALKLGGANSTAPAPVATRTPPAPDPQAIARLLGGGALSVATAPVPTLASRFALLGVVATREKGGAALIAVDGRPPKPFRVGAPIDEGLLLQSVDSRHATLAPSLDGPAAVTLEMPLRK